MGERNAFGKRIRDLIEAKDRSIRYTAGKVGMDSGHLSRIVAGERPPPNLVYIARLAKVLEVDVMELLQLADVPEEILEAFAESEKAHAYFTRVRKRKSGEEPS
jgi:transcriptional regulator with XRE-family HTH domain